jgi:Fic-DOC domain mobile mystery protein B
MIDAFSADEDATPLDPQERNGLIPTHVTLRRELNELEHGNILEADAWAFSRKRKVLGEAFLCNLHRRMFGKVWKWAGAYRTTKRNLGVTPYRIQTDLCQLINDVRYWIDNKTYTPDEIAVRFHHRLVSIHPFPNGNGRWSRLATDLLVVASGGNRFTWGGANIQKQGDVRRSYINSLRAADDHDIQPLLQFARS